MERWAPRVAADSMYLGWGILALSGEFLPLPILRVSARAGGVARTVGVARNRGVARTEPAGGSGKANSQRTGQNREGMFAELEKKICGEFWRDFAFMVM